MTTIQVDQELKTRLTSGGDTVLVCDEQGQRIGVFLPDEKDEEMYKRARELFVVEELDRREQEPGGTTLAEILEKIEAACTTS